MEFYYPVEVEKGSPAVELRYLDSILQFSKTDNY